MAKWTPTKIGQFLKEREGRYKPNDEAISGLKRLNKIDFSGEIHVNEKPTKTNMICVEPGDLVISGINVSKGAIAVYHGDEPITATIHYSSYMFDEDQIDIEYFKRFLKSPTFVKALKEQVKGGIKTEIKAKKFLPIEIKLPGIDEQKDIVNFFNRIEDEMKELTGEISKQKKLFKKFRQQILQDAIEGKLTKKWREQSQNLITGKNHPSELLKKIKENKDKLLQEKKYRKETTQEPAYTLPIKVPNEWISCRVIDITKQVTDGTHQTPTYVKDGEIFLSAQNVKPFKFMPQNHKYVSKDSFDNFRKNRIPEKGDLLIARVGAGIGETAVIDRDIEFAFYVSLGLIKLFTEYTLPDYLAIVFNSPYGVLYSKGNISSGGTSAGNYNLGRIRAFEIPLPSVYEQQAVIKQVNKIMLIIDGLEEQVIKRKKQSEMLRQLVLMEAFEN